MHTAYEISAGLSRRGIEDDIAQNVVRELTVRGYIDDLNFAQVWVASRSVQQLHGRLRLLRDLKQKGVPDEIVHSVLSDSLSDEDELAVAIKAAEKKLRTMRVAGRVIGKVAGRVAGKVVGRSIGDAAERANGTKGRVALYRYLRSRGFTTQVISQAMGEIIFEEDSS
jgi:SOS response regulatory protein OraA/RecX